MQADVRAAYQRALDASHHGRPVLVTAVRTGGRGRPRIVIDRGFLEWAYAHRGSAGIADFLGVSRTTVRNALLDYDIAEPGVDPFPTALPPGPSEPALNEAGPPPLEPIRNASFASQQTQGENVMQRNTAISPWTDDELDEAIFRLRVHYPKAGQSMLHGMLQRLGHRVPKERIGHSLLRIDPVKRVFERIRIQRRSYHVPGPNALWHHDGQHGQR